MKACAGDRNEFPVVAVGPQCELQHAKRGRIPDFAVCLYVSERVQTLATGAHHEFAKAARRIGLAIRILERDPAV